MTAATITAGSVVPWRLHPSKLSVVGAVTSASCPT